MPGLEAKNEAGHMALLAFCHLPLECVRSVIKVSSTPQNENGTQQTPLGLKEHPSFANSPRARIYTRYRRYTQVAVGGQEGLLILSLHAWGIFLWRNQGKCTFDSPSAGNS